MSVVPNRTTVFVNGQLLKQHNTLDSLYHGHFPLFVFGIQSAHERLGSGVQLRVNA